MARIHNAQYMRVVAAALFLAACAYLGAGLFDPAARRPTAAASPVQLTESVALQGIALRREEVFPAPEQWQPPSDGGRVPAGKLLFSDKAQGGVRAPASALCLAGGDGYESLSPDMLQPFTLERVEALMDYTPAKSDGTVCRLVYDYCWCYAAVTEEPCRLESGAQAELVFEGMDGPAAAQVSAVDGSGGKTALLLRVGAMGAEYLRLRECSAELIIREYSGLKIPAAAVREDGSGKNFVNILTAGREDRREVEIIYTDGEMSIAAFGSGENALHAGDTVVINREG